MGEGNSQDDDCGLAGKTCFSIFQIKDASGMHVPLHPFSPPCNRDFFPNPCTDCTIEQAPLAVSAPGFSDPDRYANRLRLAGR